ncbi:unnamed protein product [Blumeria hordei]|uniref:Protein kinase domain-containing protein n=1 Tax=Blumeria hordei TaxID=2867405 RepID=A0A383UNC7_BLUHO|nr:unnamed protein product [Blumeria hordei]
MSDVCITNHNRPKVSIQVHRNESSSASRKNDRTPTIPPSAIPAENIKPSWQTKSRILTSKSGKKRRKYIRYLKHYLLGGRHAMKKTSITKIPTGIPLQLSLQNFSPNKQLYDLDSDIASHALPPGHSNDIMVAPSFEVNVNRLGLHLQSDPQINIAGLYSEYSGYGNLMDPLGKIIGKGSSANVRLIKKKGVARNRIFAVKEFRSKSTTETPENYEKRIISEFLIAKSLRHPNIVQTLELYINNGRYNYVMEYCEQGDLFNLVIQKYLSHEDRQLDRFCLFKQLIRGLKYLHNSGIAHRDVKLENLLITQNSKLKIADFGVSEVFYGDHPGSRTISNLYGEDVYKVRKCPPGICGSTPYVAPEVIARQNEYDPRPLDVWGAAIVMLCMTKNGPLWHEAKAKSSSIYDELVKNWAEWNFRQSAPLGDTGCSNVSPPPLRPTLSDNTFPEPKHLTRVAVDKDYPSINFFDRNIHPPALRRLLLKMLNPNPDYRLSILEVAQSHWVRNIECCQVDSFDNPAATIDAVKGKCFLDNGQECPIQKIASHNHLPSKPKNVGRHLINQLHNIRI